MIRGLLKNSVKNIINEYTSRGEIIRSEKVRKKLELCQKRHADIVKVEAKGKIHSIEKQPNDTQEILYDIHFKYLIKQGRHLYLEEEVENRKALYYNDKIYQDIEIPIIFSEWEEDFEAQIDNASEERIQYQYERLKAVQYAEKWWNSYNPAYKKFENDCTNFISQCLHAGNAPMRGFPTKGKGWWMQNHSWSYSWTIANSLRWYIPKSTLGLRGRHVESPEQLKLGDVICYDFQGDGRFDHTTIVTGKDAAGMPLVNAHTYNSRMRYWNYEDSTAYTPNMKYKFLTIIDDR